MTPLAAAACVTQRHGASSKVVQGGTHLVPLRKKQQLYFLYEKRIRDLSNSEKVFEYFANEKLPDGSAHMRPQDLLAALVPVYPPEGEQARAAPLPTPPIPRPVAPASAPCGKSYHSGEVEI